MARAISSLPTPDWPSISTGMLDAAAFSAVRSTPRMRALRVMMSLKVSVPARLRLMRASSLSSARVASALRSDTCSRSAPTGLTTKSAAPARIALTTLSIPPCAVCTMTGMLRPASRIRASTPMPSRSGMTRSRMTASMVAPSGLQSSCSRGLAAFGDHRLVAGLANHVVEKSAGDGIVIDDQNTLTHVRNLYATQTLQGGITMWGLQVTIAVASP